MKLSNPYPHKLLLASLAQLSKKHSNAAVLALSHAELEAELAALSSTSLQQTLAPQLRDFGVLVCDLRGFTAVSERYPLPQVVALLNQFYCVMVDMIDRHGGIIDKFMGDSVLAIFDSKNNPDTPARMLTCMLDMQLAMEGVNAWAHAHKLPDLYMGIGASYGKVMLCELGSSVYRELTVLGDTVNLAARITAYCLRGQILISAKLSALLTGKVLLGATNDVHFKGKHEPTQVLEVLGQILPHPLILPVRELRRSYRVDVDLGLSFMLIRGKEVDHNQTNARVVNISRSGLRMHTTKLLDYADELKLLLPFLPTNDNREVYARVVSNIALGEGSYSPCVEFTYLDEDTSKALNIFVDHLV